VVRRIVDIDQIEMSNFLAITCPHCGEDFEVSFDPSEGDAEFIIDCEVCCRPMTVTVRTHSGEIDSVQVQAA
jgi:ribosomal protein S27E